MLLSVDHGNYAIKTPFFSFISGLSEHTSCPPLADELLEYEGRFWTLSGKRISYMRDKTQDDRFFILTLFAIARELVRTGSSSPLSQIDLAVGLPPEHYGVLKDRFANYFKRKDPIRFVYHDRPYMIAINHVLVFPQAYAAVIPNSDLVIKTARLFLVDIGGYTTDVLLLRYGKPDLQFCRSLESGIITMNNEIIRKVNSLHDLLIDDEHISAVLSGQDTILPSEVQKTITDATHLHANNILNQLRELQIDLRSNPVVFIGGGSLLLKPFIVNSPLVAKTISLEDLPEDQCPIAPAPVLRETEFDFEEERLARAFSELSVERQKLLTLVFLYDLKPEEAAEVLHYSIKKFYNNKYEALKKLRTMLSEQEDSHER